MAEEGGSLGLPILPPFLLGTHNVTEEGRGSQDTRPNITDQREMHDHKQTTVVIVVRGWHTTLLTSN
jgi:hypothetical protein